jgi:hypothetical protein
MSVVHGYKAKYDYVEITVKQDGDRWLLMLNDRRHGDNVVHDEEFATALEAQDAALAVAQHHINVAHNDTLLHQSTLTWKEY